MSNRNIRTRRVSGWQLEILWEFLNSHRTLATSFNRSLQDKEHSKRMWKELANSLNAQGVDGAVKEWKECAKYWVDYKAKLKKHISSLRSAESGTGGPWTVQPLSEIENKFLQILGEDFGQGLPGVRVEPFPEVWTDWKAKTKKKLIEFRRREASSGQASQLTLTDCEQRVLRVMGALPAQTERFVEEQNLNVWNNLKYVVRTKLVKRNENQGGTGGGPSNILTPLEGKIATILSRDCGPLPNVRHNQFMLDSPRPRNSPQQSDSETTEPLPSTSHDPAEGPKTNTDQKKQSFKTKIRFETQDEYESFALMISTKIKSLKDLKQRVECMNEIKNVVAQYLANNKAVLKDQSAIDKQSEETSEDLMSACFMEVEKQEPMSPENNDYLDESENALAASKDINDYFEVDDDRQTRCLVCCETLNDGEDPRNHLEEQHPTVLEEILRDDDRNSDASSTKSSEDQEVISVNSYPPTKKRKNDTQTEIETKRRRSSTAKNDYEIQTKDTDKIRKSVSSDQVDTFLNYVKVLLNKMPPEMCTKVQLDVLNVIVTAQIGKSTSNLKGQKGSGANG